VSPSTSTPTTPTTIGIKVSGHSAQLTPNISLDTTSLEKEISTISSGKTADTVSSVSTITSSSEKSNTSTQDIFQTSGLIASSTEITSATIIEALQTTNANNNGSLASAFEQNRTQTTSHVITSPSLNNVRSAGETGGKYM
jgi:hypothetical protein